MLSCPTPHHHIAILQLVGRLGRQSGTTPPEYKVIEKGLKVIQDHVNNASASARAAGIIVLGAHVHDGYSTRFVCLSICLSVTSLLVSFHIFFASYSRFSINKIV